MKSTELNNTKIYNLEIHRFNISPESMLLMKETRDFYKNLQNDFPELRAMSFFGSRILGHERKASTQVFEHKELGSVEQKTLESDLDLVILYDGEAMDELEARKDDEAPRHQLINQKILIFSDELKKVKGITNRLHFCGFDVSTVNTEKTLTNFKSLVLSSSEEPLEIKFSLHEDSVFYALAARFLLSIGDINSVREAVITNFEQDKRGELYWKILMSILSEFERPELEHHDDSYTPRGLPKYKYPATLAEGRSYFLNGKHVAI